MWTIASEHTLHRKVRCQFWCQLVLQIGAGGCAVVHGWCGANVGVTICGHVVYAVRCPWLRDDAGPP